MANAACNFCGPPAKLERNEDENTTAQEQQLSGICRHDGADELDDALQ